MAKKKHRKNKHKAQVIAQLESQHVATLKEAGKEEPVVLAAVPKSMWERFVDWIEKGSG